jgi:hypothetical protein
MEESRPATAAPPDDSAAPEEPAAQEEKPRRERRRLHVPTSVLVTLFVTLLSIWVAPAFARQWDDRQKARELKADLTDEVATATARTLAAGLAVARTPPGGGGTLTLDGSLSPDTGERADRYHAADANWDAAALKIGLKLRVQFGAGLAKRWAWFAYSVDAFLWLCLNTRAAKGPDSPTSQLRLQRLFGAIVALRQAADYARAKEPPGPPPSTIGSGELFREYIEDAPAGKGEEYESSAVSLQYPIANTRARALDGIHALMWQNTEQLTAAIIAAHPPGFSTTRGDLLRDLLP